ncbi:MAG: sialidase family protein [Planctomycetota bacterium]
MGQLTPLACRDPFGLCELKPVGDWGGIVVMGFVGQLKEPGHYLAMFHDDGRFFTKNGERKTPVEFRLYKTFSKDGGLTWSEPEMVQKDTAVHLCEPGLIRSPDGKQMAVLLRENSRRRNSYVIFSDDEGQYRVRLMDNHKGADCAYPAVEILPDGTIVTTTYGHWDEDQPASIVSVRLKLEELDKRQRKE